MSKSAFASLIIKKLKSAIGTDGKSYGDSSASSAMSAVASAITEYLIANTQVTITYNGIIPGTPPVPDPVVTDMFKIVGSCAPPSPSDSFDDWLHEIESNIIAGFSLATMGAAGVAFPNKPFDVTGISTVQENLKSAHDVGDGSPQQKIWEIICQGIMDWINSSAMNSVPGGATRPSAPSSGQAVITKILIT